jgi:hypothetical protein
VSIPTLLNVVTLSENSDVAGIAAALLRGNNIGGYNPRIVAVYTNYTNFSTEKSSFFTIGDAQKINIYIAAYYQIVDARRVDIWLALDPVAAGHARTYIINNGPPPNNYYRGIFPDPVVPCGFNLPHRPSTKKGFDEWLNFLMENLRSWKERIWEIYRDSS